MIELANHGAEDWNAQADRQAITGEKRLSLS
jgi:hypothetical protein